MPGRVPCLKCLLAFALLSCFRTPHPISLTLVPTFDRAISSKVSTVAYSASAANVGRHCLSNPQCACMHVRMPLGEGCDKDALISPYPKSTATPLFKTGLRFGPTFTGRGALRDEGSVWERVVRPQMAKILITAVLLAREAGALAHHRLVQAKSVHAYRRVLLLSPDFIVDESGTAFCEEV